MNGLARSLPTTLASPINAVPIAGLVAGTLDLVYICTLWSFFGVGPQRILQSVAEGWLGPDAARGGGMASAALGLGTHYAIAIAMACTYWLAARRWRVLVDRPLAGGLCYGVLLYVVMNFVVVPLSAAAHPPPRLHWMQAAHLCAHMVLVGIPCALGARAALRQRAPSRNART